MRWLPLAAAWLIVAPGCASLLGDPFDDLKPERDGGVKGQSKDPSEAAGAGATPIAGSVSSGPAGSGAKTETPAAVPAPDAGEQTGQAGQAATPPKDASANPPRDPPAAKPSQEPSSTTDELDAGSDAFPALDQCTPSFGVSNGVVYPRRSAGARVFTGDSRIDTNPGSPDCAPEDEKNCVVVGESIRIDGKVGVAGRRALVLIAAGDVVVNDWLNVAGGDGNQSDDARVAPGDHTLGMSKTVAGGGGNATQGGGTYEGTGAGSSIPLGAGLIGGGHGSQQPDDLGRGCFAGGGGGGALQIVSLCGAIQINSYINARGGGGAGGAMWNHDCPDGTGGGAGGTVWLQARALSFGPAPAGPVVQLSGGSGGGGACYPAGSTTPTSGVSGSAYDPTFHASGADCQTAKGGIGGQGGAQNVLPMRGGAPTPAGMPDAARGGGGGGARGRIILQDLPNTCAEISSWTDGECSTAAPGA